MPPRTADSTTIVMVPERYQSKAEKLGAQLLVLGSFGFAITVGLFQWEDIHGTTAGAVTRAVSLLCIGAASIGLIAWPIGKLQSWIRNR